MVFWWTGRGYLSLLFLIGTLGVFGAIVSLTVGDAAFEIWPWLWGVGFLLAATVNWFGGSYVNKRSFNLAAGGFKARLLYRARNRFLSTPMEIWSAPLAVFGAVLIVRGMVAP